MGFDCRWCFWSDPFINVLAGRIGFSGVDFDSTSSKYMCMPVYTTYQLSIFHSSPDTVSNFFQLSIPPDWAKTRPTASVVLSLPGLTILDQINVLPSKDLRI
jgi:hypothetical protein